MIRAGTLTDRVTILRFTTNVDLVWGSTPGWNGVTETWANVVTLGGAERADAQDSVQTSISHRVTIRYRADLTTKDRLLFRGRTLEIVAIIPDARRTEQVIEAREHEGVQ